MLLRTCTVSALGMMQAKHAKDIMGTHLFTPPLNTQATAFPIVLHEQTILILHLHGKESCLDWQLDLQHMVLMSCLLWAAIPLPAAC